MALIVLGNCILSYPRSSYCGLCGVMFPLKIDRILENIYIQFLICPSLEMFKYKKKKREHLSILLHATCPELGSIIINLLYKLRNSPWYIRVLHWWDSTRPDTFAPGSTLHYVLYMAHMNILKPKVSFILLTMMTSSSSQLILKNIFSSSWLFVEFRHLHCHLDHFPRPSVQLGTLKLDEALT